MSYQELDRVRVMERVIGKRLTQREAARILGVTSRHMRRLRQAYERGGAQALVSRHRGHASHRRLPTAVRREALATVRSRYEGFGPTLAHEKLTERHGMKLSVETLRHWMIEDGLWIPRARRAPRIQQPRRRRPCRGELVQVDGCDHTWFEARAPRCTLLVFVDDATSALMELRFCASESAFSYFAAMRSYLQRHGKPVALYSDQANVFRVHRPGAQRASGVTQFARALGTLNIDIVCANTPAAKGRVERAHLTLQDRLVKELRLQGIGDLEAANAFTPEFIADYNRRFARAPHSEHDAHRRLQPSDDLTRILSWQETRVVSQRLTLNYKRVLYVLDPTEAARAARGQRVRIEEWEDGSLSLWHGEHGLQATAFPKEHSVEPGEIVENKRLSATLEFIKKKQRERAEAEAAKPFVTLRKARQLRAGAQRRTTVGSPAKVQP